MERMINTLLVSLILSMVTPTSHSICVSRHHNSTTPSPSHHPPSSPLSHRASRPRPSPLPSPQGNTPKPSETTSFHTDTLTPSPPPSPPPHHAGRGRASPPPPPQESIPKPAETTSFHTDTLTPSPPPSPPPHHAGRGRASPPPSFHTDTLTPSPPPSPPPPHHAGRGRPSPPPSPQENTLKPPPDNHETTQLDDLGNTLFTRSTIKADPGLKRICDDTDYPSLCLSSLSASLANSGKSFSFSTALGFAIQAATQHALRATAALAKLAKAPGADEDAGEGLGVCKDSYSDALDNLQAAVDAMLAKDVATANSMLSAVVTDSENCVDALEGTEAGTAMTKYNDKLRMLASNCLAIASFVK